MFVPDFDAQRKEDLEIAGELSRIFADGSIGIAYQPIVDARTTRIVCAEALARWPSSSPRHLTPDRFVRVAESHGLIDDL
jgi:sensor c-di-GMP phosphodiesterase-like protein